MVSTDDLALNMFLLEYFYLNESDMNIFFSFRISGNLYIKMKRYFIASRFTIVVINSIQKYIKKWSFYNVIEFRQNLH